MATPLILLSSIFYTSLSVIPLGEWKSGGQATKHSYVGSQSPTACGFINTDNYLDGIPPHPSHHTNFPFGYVSAVGTVPVGSSFDNLFSPGGVQGEGCGACYEIKCLGIFGGAQEGCVCNTQNVVVQAIDYSGLNPEPHFDIAIAGFHVIAGAVCGRVSIDYRQVACEIHSNIYITTDWNDAWSYYLNFYNVAGNGKLCGVEMKSSHLPGWMTCSNIGSKWKCDDSMFEPTVLPLSFRLTDCAGNIVTAMDVVTAFGAISADLGVNFPYGGGGSSSTSTTTTTTTTTTTSTSSTTSSTTSTSTTSTSLAPVGGISYPYFVSYVGQIGPWWGVSYNEVLLSNLGVPGFSNHPYNVLNFAFWFSSTNKGAYGTATGSWENLATYITSTTLRNTLTGLANPTSAQLRTAIKAIYVSNNIKIFVSAFGATDHPQSAGRNPTTVATNLGNYAITHLYDGVDIDWEEGSFFNAAGAGEAWLTTLTNVLSSTLNPSEKKYYITHAPQAPYFMGSTLSQYLSGGYLTVHTNVGHLIDWYNVQFYNQGSTAYNTYWRMFKASIGWSKKSAVYQMINGDNPEGVSIPSSKIVVGKHSLGDGSDFVSGSTLKSIFNQALVSTPHWNTGFMIWQFYTENNQSPAFQVANEVVTADWDFTGTLAPTISWAPTPSPVPTTAVPTSNGGGSGCVSGNICIKVKGFSLATPTPATPVWWWAIYDENIIDSLSAGCAITDCSSIQIKQSSTSVWVTGATQNNDCSFSMGPNPFTSHIISVDFKITSTNGHVIESIGVVQTTTANTEWDFGSNFGSCSDVSVNPSISPTKNPTSTTTSTSTTATPTKSPSHDPTVSPTKNPTVKPSQNPTSSPNVLTSLPTSGTPNPSQNPTLKPSQNPTTHPAQNPTQNPSKNPTATVSENPTLNPLTPTATPSTNPTAHTSYACITSCTGIVNGNYASCYGCNYFATCANGYIYDQRACPADLVFEGRGGYCARESSTCSGSALMGHDNKNGATQPFYIVLAMILLVLFCCVVALILKRVYSNKKSKAKTKKSQVDLANVIQMNDLSSYPGPTHVALPSRSTAGVNTNTSTDGSRVGFGADSGGMLSVQPPMGALSMVKSYSVGSVNLSEANPVRIQVNSQGKDIEAGGNSFVI